jgi:hypothetical protein
VAAALYQDFEFWPGPLGDDGRPVDPDDCSDYDRIYLVTANDLAAYEAGSAPTPDLADWPVTLGAPVVDGDGIPGNYDLAAGDRPDVRGASTAFWIMNDGGNAHWTTGSPPFGIEVRVIAFAEATDTYYRYTLANRSGQTIRDLRIGFYADADLGGHRDDYMGSDSLLHLGYVYNADDFDEDLLNEGEVAQAGYGEAPPAIGAQMLSGAAVVQARLLGPCPVENPFLGRRILLALEGLRDCGAGPITEGGNGGSGTGDVTTYYYSGDPVEGRGWTEATAGIEPGDRRMLVVSTPTTLAPGASHSADVAVLYARSKDHLASVTALKAKAAATLEAYETGDLFPVSAEPGAPSLPFAALSAYPNPSAGSVTLAYRLAAPGPARLVVYDALGREVARLSGGAQSAAMQRVRLDGSALPAGLYVAVLEAGARREAVRFSIVR